MESVGQPGSSGACNLLGVPGLDPLEVDDDEWEVVTGIRPKSSPRPRRRSSDSDEDSGPEPPLSGSRRVSFADAKGLSLVRVKEFDTWDVPKLPDSDSSEGAGIDAEVYFLSPLTFSLPLSTEELFVRVQEQKMELETIELLPGTTILRGVIRVLNISFNKAVFVRTTLNTWSSHFDLLAEYMPGSSDRLTDRFSFKLTLVPPFRETGARVDFCLRYETPVGTFWNNNNDRNYVLFCHRRVKERKEMSQQERVNKKSCLKTVSKSFSIVENLSATEVSSQENISTDVSEHEETVKAEQISDGQSGTSEEDRQKLLTEDRQNCSRRSCRKATRIARVRDYFSQRDGGADDTESDESPPEANQAAPEETPEQKHSDVRSFPDGSSKSEGSHFVSETLETCSEPLVDVPRDTSPAHDHTSDGETDKSESVNLADSATLLTGGERATVIPDNPSNDEPASAESQNINKSVSKAEESSQKQGPSCECISNIAAQPADSDISAGSSESLDGQTNSFSFGTVVAPLYPQVFGRVGNASDWRNPAQAPLHPGDLSYRHTERRWTRCSVPSDARGNNGDVQGHVLKSQESNQEYLVTNSPPMEKEETSLSVTANDVHAETLRDPDDIIHSDQRRTNTSEVPETIPGDTVAHPHAANILNTDLLKPQKPAESLHLQGEAREDNLTHDPKLPEHTCTQTKTNRDEALADSYTQEVTSSFMSLQPSESVSERVSDEAGQHASGRGADDCERVHESNKEEDVCETVTISATTAVSEEDKAVEASHHLNPKHMNNSATEETEISYISSFDIVEEKDVTTPQMPLETNNVEEGNQVANNSPKEETKKEIIAEVANATINNHVRGDMFVELEDEDAQNTEHREMEAAVAKQEDSCFADTPVVNWEMMVEEEEKSIITDEEESEATRSRTVGKDQRQLEDKGTLENKDTTEAEKEDTMVWEIKAAREKKNEAEDGDVSEGKQKIGQEIGEIMAGKDREEVAKELQYVPDTNEAGEEDLAEEIEEEKQEETELEEENHFAEIHEVDIEKTNVQNEQDMEEGEEMEKDLSDDDEAGVEWEDQVKPREVDVEEENPDYKEECFVVEMAESESIDAESEIIDAESEIIDAESEIIDAESEIIDAESEIIDAESEIIDAESESMTREDGQNEAGCFEVRLDVTQNKVGDGLSAPVNNVQDKRVIDRENGCIPTEMHLYEEADFQSEVNVPRDLTEAAGDESGSVAAEGGSLILTYEPENDQWSHDSASAESDSDDEVELYMHCLRAVHTGARAQADRNKDSKVRPSVGRGKLPPTPMPSISETQDEEQHPGRLLDPHEDMETADVQPTAAALPASNGPESIDRNVSWFEETFSCSNISKTLLYATLLVVFLVVANRYDFLACFGLYLVSVVWLYCQGERQPKHQQKNNRIG